MKGLIVGTMAIFGFVLFMDTSSQGGDKKDPVSIKVVMQKAMKGGLCGKVAKGKASDDEKKQLVALFTDLAANKPPMGDEGAWKERTKALLDAAKADDGKALQKAANCKSCHETFKK